MKIHFVCLATLFAVISCQTPKERYIILLYKGSPDAMLDHIIEEVEKFESSTRQELHLRSQNFLLPIIFGNVSAEAAQMVSDMEIVHMVEKDQIMRASSIYPPDICFDFQNLKDTNRYNLDIIDEVYETDGTFLPPNYGKGVDIYVVDTGVNYDHEDFKWRNGTPGTRAFYPGSDPIDMLFGGNQQGRDCNGHGTHCAGVAAGLCSGVAKDATVYSLRALDCDGFGSIESVYHGIYAAYYYHSFARQRPEFVASIVSMSLGGGKTDILNEITNTVVEEGVVIVTASGNSATDACNDSPGGAGMNINVGAHGYDRATGKKHMAYFSNYGECVDIMAPGLHVVSASHSDNTGYIPLSGTSMSCPHVAGLAALIKLKNNSLTPDEVKEAIKANAIDDIDRSRMRPIVRLEDRAKRAFID